MTDYKVIIWDIDGTLLDTHAGILTALRYTLGQLGVQKSDDEILAMVHTSRIKDAFINIANMDEGSAKQATDMFRNYYITESLFHAIPYSGIMDVLLQCKKMGFNMAVASNKRQDCATGICQHFGIDAFCNPICGTDRYNTLSKADLLKKALDFYNVTDLSTAVMIGDTDGDKTAAKQAGIDFIGVNYGFGFHDVPEYANSPSEILDLLKSK